MSRNMKDFVLYIHGKGGSAAEYEHYRPLFPGCEVFGLDYRTFTPWETGPEIRAAAEKLKDECANIILIANSIGAYFSMSAGIDSMIREAYFISPIVDMERLISDCVTSYDPKKLPEMFRYYMDRGCEVRPLDEYRSMA